MNNNKDTFVLHASLYHQFVLLNDEQAGRIMKALLKYVLDGTVPVFSDMILSIVWAAVKTQIDENAEKYEARCLKNKENIRKRWKKTDTNVSEENESIQTNTNVNECIPNDMILNDVMLGDMSSTTQLSSDKSSDNVSVCENSKTHTRTHKEFLKFKEDYKSSCPRLYSSQMSQPNERGFIAMMQLCGGDSQKFWSILMEMNNKKDTVEKYTSVTQTFKVFADRSK